MVTGRDVTIAGDLTVNGTTTTVNSQTLSVDDPLISLAINNAANSLDIGYYGKYNDGTTRYLGLFSDASDSNKFRLFKGTTVEPTTTVNIGSAGYAAADLELANLISTGTISGVLANGVTATTQSAGDASTKVATTAYVDTSAGLYLPLAGGTLTGDLTGTSATFAGNVVINNSDARLNGGNTAGRFIVSNSDTTSYISLNGSSNASPNDISIITDEEILFNTGSGYSEAMRITSTGNVGIGTDSPSTKLHVSSSDNANWTTTVQNTLTSDSHTVYTAYNNSSSNLRYGVYISGAGTTASDYHLLVNDQFAVVGSGNVGIGTTSPSANLDIFNGTTGASLKLSATATAYWQLQRNPTTGNLNISDDALGNVMSFDQLTGNVGIGTDSPDVKLHLKGTDIRLRLQENTSNVTAVTNDMEGLELSMLGVSGIGRYTPMLKFMSADTSFTTKNPKLLAYVTGISEASYITDTGGKMGLSFGTSPIVATGVPVERMRIDGDGNVGIGTDSPLSKLHAKGGSISTPSNTSDFITNATARLVVNHSNEYGVYVGYLNSTNDATGIQSARSNGQTAPLSLNPYGGNVGIGTTSPSEKLTVSGGSSGYMTTIENTTAGGDYLQMIGDAGSPVFQFDSGGTGGEAYFSMYKDNVKKILLDANVGVSYINAGNVGIGTDSPTNGKLVIDSTGFQTSLETGTAGDGRLNIGHFSNGAFIGTYGDDGGGADIIRFGTHSGDERMRITSGGTVDIYSGGGTSEKTYTATAGLQLYSQQSDASSPYTKTSDIVANGDGTVPSELRMFTKASGSSTPTERMRIASDGNIGIGTTSPDSLLNLEGVKNTSIITLGSTTNDSNWSIGDKYGAINFYSGDGSGAGAGIKASISYEVEAGATGSTNSMVFRSAGTSAGTNNTERMRITSGGNVLIGTQGTPNGTSVYGSGFIKGSNSRSTLNMATSSTILNAHLWFYNPNGAVGYIATTGSQTNYTTTSDYRLKEDLKEFNGLEMVSNISVYDYKWKADESRSYGVMAHELQEVLPDAVVGEKDAEEMQGVDYSKIVPLLIKSIQELTAKVERLEAK